MHTGFRQTVSALSTQDSALSTIFRGTRLAPAHREPGPPDATNPDPKRMLHPRRTTVTARPRPAHGA